MQVDRLGNETRRAHQPGRADQRTSQLAQLFGRLGGFGQEADTVAVLGGTAR